MMSPIKKTTTYVIQFLVPTLNNHAIDPISFYPEKEAPVINELDQKIKEKTSPHGIFLVATSETAGKKIIGKTRTEGQGF